MRTLNATEVLASLLSVMVCVAAMPKDPSNSSAGGSGTGLMVIVGTCVRSVCSSRLGVPVLSSAARMTPGTASPFTKACTWARSPSAQCMAL